MQTIQNKFIRFVLDLSSRTHIGLEQFVQVKWLPVEKRVHQIMLCHLHKINNNRAPDYLKTNVISVGQRHSYNTRSSVSSFIVDRAGSYGKKTFNHVAKTLWNDLPNHIRHIVEYNRFKFLIKKHFLAFLEQSENSPFTYF
jgi:hypothetical protein